MGKLIGYFVLFFLLPTRLQEPLPFNFVIWNVGQGSWSTFLWDGQCFHFDMGGETLPFGKVLPLCYKKKNWILLSHEDWDHLNGIPSFMGKIKDLCLSYHRPPERSFLKKMKPCPRLPSLISLVDSGQLGGSRNSSSVVYRIQDQVLIPGDSPMKEEKRWMRKLPRSMKGLLLGHHGSHTSTSMALLQWIQPRWAVASGRKSKYGHPHRRVSRKLRKRGISLLRTEVWGHIYMKLHLKTPPQTL